MTSFPSLFPQCASDYIKEAHNKIWSYHRTGRNLLREREPDSLRLVMAADNIRNRCFPLLTEMNQSGAVPSEWLKRLSDCIHTIENDLRETAGKLQDLGEVIER